MVNKVIELRDIYDNVLLPYAHAAVRDGDNNIITSTYATIQTVNTKQDIITGAASSITSSDLDPSKVVVSNISGKITTAPITSTELGYLSGATENIPTAINTIKDMLLPEDASAGDVLIINDDKTALVPGGSIYHPALFSYQPADHLLNDIQWLRADTFSWQSGNVYKTAYNHLVADLGTIEQTIYYAWVDNFDGENNYWYTTSATPSVGDNAYKIQNWSIYETSTVDTFGADSILVVGDARAYTRDTTSDIINQSDTTSSGAVRKTETIGSYTITYWLALDGHKICTQDQEQTVYNIYIELGDALYYILDTENVRFKLPRKKDHGGIIKTYTNGPLWYRLYDDGWVEQGGNFGAAFSSWTDKTTTFLIPFKDTNYWVNAISGHTSNTDSPCINTKTTTTFMCRPYNSTGNANWIASGYSNINVSDKTPKQYLYFYVGEFAQSAIEETAGITVEVLNDKLDADLGNSKYSKFDVVIDYQEPTASNNYTWYRLYKSGWVEQGGQFIKTANPTYCTLPVVMANVFYYINTSFNSNNSVSKYEKTAYFLKETTRFGMKMGSYNAQETNTDSTTCIWEVKGFAAR